MNSIFFLILLIPLSIPVAFGEIEQGFNYNIELVQNFPDGTAEYRWTSAPDRILEDGDYENYLFTNNDDYLRFESEQITFEFSESSCDFKLYDTGKVNGSPLIESYSNIISINGNPINLPVCNVNNITEDDDGVSFEVNRGPVSILFNLDYSTGAEWTYDIVGNGVITVTEVCENCTGVMIDDQRIKFGNYILDTKNNIHGTFKEASQQGNNYHIIYEAISNGRLIIDPIFSEDTTEDRMVAENDNDGLCEDTGGGSYYIDTSGNLFSQFKGSPSGDDCYKSYAEFDISTIPDDATVSDLVWIIEVNTVTTIDHDIYEMSGTQPSTEAVAATLFGLINDGTKVVDDQTISATGSLRIDLTSTGITGLETVLLSAQNWIAYGIEVDSAVSQTGSDQGILFDSTSGSVPSVLEVTFIGAFPPDRVDDLSSTDITDTTVDLLWTEPALNGGTLEGYQINYTTPFGDPTTIITNNTENSDVTTQISGLTQDTDYSIRVGVWTESFNMTGNILNVTTNEDFTLANFTVGSFDVNATNPDIIQMFFERQDINSTALFLNVTYPNSYNLACDFSYQFANINQTYTNLSNVTISADAIESSFLFADVDNEVIDVYCWDQNNLDNDGTYIITQTSFPLLQQIQNFRSGEYGTQGMFGAIDLITMAVIIISMIGFNRVNESVGAIFNIILLGSLAYFEIIELPTIIFGAVAVILMLVIASTRKK